MSTPITESAAEILTTDEIRKAFPALAREHNGFPVAYFDAPGGTQTPRVVVDAVADYLLNHNANTHWEYPTSHETDAIIESARKTFADFLNASANEIVWIRPASTAPAAGIPRVAFAQVAPIVAQRCAVCHSLHPTLTSAAPKGIVLDSASQIRAQASLIKTVAVDTHVMPLSNATQMTDAERKLLGAWIDQGAKTP